MALKDYIFTSESVSEGHPDKVCDQISDAILDAFITNDVKHGLADDSHANTRLGCETLATTNKIVIAGEGRASEPYMRKYGKHTIVNREALAQIARDVVRDIGYDQDGFSFHGADIEVRAVGAERLHLVVAGGVDDEQPADHLARLRIGAVGHGDAAVATAQHPALAVAQLVPDDGVAGRLDARAPVDVAADDGLNLLRPEAFGHGAGIVEEEEVAGHGDSLAGLGTRGSGLGKSVRCPPVLP